MNRIREFYHLIGDKEVERVEQSMRLHNISQGEVTIEFENSIADFLGVKHAVAVSNGTSALLLSLMALGVGPHSEVIVPNRTFIATAHAPLLLGAKVVLVDAEPNRPILNVSKTEERITKNTKVIIPAHLNGRSVDMAEINSLAEKYSISVIEDAAQALGSRNRFGYLGTQSDIGCFSLSMGKIITSGQGGVAVTNDSDLADIMRKIRTQGLRNITYINRYNIPGFNFKFTDIQASIALVQIASILERIKRLNKIYREYNDALSQHEQLRPIAVDIDNGEVPLYNEYLCFDRDNFVKYLDDNGIQCRPFYPDLDRAEYMGRQHSQFINSRKFEKYGVYLPGGAGIDDSQIKIVVQSIQKYFSNH
ncbi:MAG: DegT/DnrJ/EryC1/StrS family aminotransferase [Desulfobacterales bacterium]|jgi:dTDP-4-amino-4,6-dideoxygalactose transaminase|nr:DegT/DnrJ/EryC1/StrS family aminotransferase [Desulfobacterales bacterium]MDP6808202.1 DegT/DnrJ/EryC1/StrS family aminotransferase [Desulfobacterales bacterium]|tara:strand:+ start:22606 stop:23697 length:1092 start_codon:yes stop_codon:yes gene_type:complete